MKKALFYSKRYLGGISMNMKFMSFGLAVIFASLSGCMTATSAVKGTPTTISTMDGYEYQALKVIEDFWQKVRIAKSNTGNCILYINVVTYNDAGPGSAIVYMDGERHTIVNPFPSGWSIDDVSGMTSYWSEIVVLSDSFIEALLRAEKVTIRVINAHVFISEGEGIDITPILPIIKDFLQKDN